MVSGALRYPVSGMRASWIVELRAEVHGILLELRSRGIGVLLTDHNVREALSLCDRACVLFAGRVLAEGTSNELIASEDVRRHFLGERSPAPAGQPPHSNAPTPTLASSRRAFAERPPNVHRTTVRTEPSRRIQGSPAVGDAALSRECSRSSRQTHRRDAAGCLSLGAIGMNAALAGAVTYAIEPVAVARRTNYFQFQATHAPSAWTRSKQIWGLPNCEQAPFCILWRTRRRRQSSWGFNHEHRVWAGGTAALRTLHTMQHGVAPNAVGCGARETGRSRWEVHDE